MTIDTAHALLGALVSRDFGALESALAPGARMRALLPSDVLDILGREAIAGRFRLWFGDANPFEVLASGAEPAGDRFAVHYRFRLRRPGADEATIAQHMFCTAEDGTVGALDLVCSGFRPLVAAPGGAVHGFDAGDMGCADGLSGEFKRRIREVAAGDLLRIHTTDPSAKEDLPALARLMGSVVRSVEANPDGSLTITVERGR